MNKLLVPSVPFLTLTLIIFFSTPSLSQGYTGVKGELFGTDKNNRVYVPGKQFTYQYEISLDDVKMKVDHVQPNNFKLTEDHNRVIKQMNMWVIKPSFFKKTNKRQTEICYQDSTQPRAMSRTGLIENDELIWLHPIRSSFFKSLETCPFPYAKLPLQVGEKWKDKMSISQFWSNIAWGEWQGQLLLNYEYEIKEKLSLSTAMGNLPCYRIEASASSSIGKTTLTSYFSETYGFIKMRYVLSNDIVITFDLIEVKEGTLYKNEKEIVLSQINQGH